MIPVVCVMEWILHNKHYSREVKASVMVVVVGVGICTVTDVKVNAKGFICASTAIFSTSLQQIVRSLIIRIIISVFVICFVHDSGRLTCYSMFKCYSDKFIFSGTQSIGSLQKKYSIGSFELLSKTAPIQALSLLIFGPFVDYFLSGRFITTYKMTYGAIVSNFLK